MHRTEAMVEDFRAAAQLQPSHCSPAKIEQAQQVSQSKLMQQHNGGQCWALQIVERNVLGTAPVADTKYF